MQATAVDLGNAAWRALRTALPATALWLCLGACATPPLENAPPATQGALPPVAAKPVAPAPKCEPEPFCMSECKRQGYFLAYCNLRCGC